MPEGSETLQLSGALLGGMAAIAAAIRWSVGRLAKSQDRAITALVENAKSSASLAAKLDNLMSRFEHLARRFDRIVHTMMERRSSSAGIVQDVAPRESQRVRTQSRPQAPGRSPGTGTFRKLSGDTLREVDGEADSAQDDETTDGRVQWDFRDDLREG